MTYKDKTFCASKGPHTCGRELTKEDHEYLAKIGYTIPVSMSYFCENNVVSEEQAYIPSGVTLQ